MERPTTTNEDGEDNNIRTTTPTDSSSSPLPPLRVRQFQRAARVQIVPPTQTPARGEGLQPQQNNSGNSSSNSRSIRLELPPGTTHVHVQQRQPQQQQRPTTSSTSNNNGGSASLPWRPRRQPLPPLQNRPLIDSRQVLRRRQDDDEKHEEEEDDLTSSSFQCRLCYEFMVQPCTCGNCTTPFCTRCLKKVLLSKGGKARCPTCRHEFSSIVPNVALQQAMQEAAPRPCRFEACSAMLRLTEIASHEAFLCPELRVTCRFASFGCTWTGRRGNVQHHEQHHCTLAQVELLVQECRNLRADCNHYAHLMAHVHQHMGQLQGRLSQMMMRTSSSVLSSRKSLSNPLDLISFLVMTMCNTPLLLMEMRGGGPAPGCWDKFVNTPTGRATVINFSLLLPTALLTLKMTCKGLRHLPLIWEGLLLLGDDNNNNTRQITDHQWDVVLDGALFAVLGFLITICFFVDDESPMKWHWYKLPIVGGELQMVPAVLAASFGMLYWLFLETIRYGAPYYFSLICVALVTSTLLLSTTVATILCRPSDEWTIYGGWKLLSTAKAFDPLCWGFAFGVLLASYGILTSVLVCVDVTAILMLAKKPFSNLPIMYLGVRLGYMAEVTSVRATVARLCSRGLPFALLAYCFVVTILGRRVGSKILRDASTQLTPGGPRRDYSGLGMLILMIWVGLLALMLVE